MKNQKIRVGLALSVVAIFLMAAALPQGKPMLKEGKERLKAWQKHLSMEKKSPFKEVPWQFLGPTNTSGRITDAAVSPDRDFILAASASGGVWKSTDMGDSWKPSLKRRYHLPSAI
jgi:hypothetical protein